MSSFPALLFKFFLHGLQQITADRVSDKKLSAGLIWGSQNLELWKWKLSQAGAAGGEVKTDRWLTGRCQSRSPCANFVVVHMLSVLSCACKSSGLMWTWGPPSCLGSTQGVSVPAFPQGQAELAVLPSICLCQETFSEKYCECMGKASNWLNYSMLFSYDSS